MRIAILRGGALGDIVLTLPVLQALRRFYPGGSICFVAPFPQAALASRGHADFLIDLNSAELVRLFDSGLDLPAPLSERLRADLIVSYLSDPGGLIRQKLRSFCANFLQGPFRLDLELRPAVEQLTQPLRSLGIPFIDFIPRLFVSTSKRTMRRLAIHPGSGSPKKNWPVERWSQLLAAAQPAFDEILLISGEADSDVTKRLISAVPRHNLRLCANLSLWDLAAELSGATLFIGHDSGVTHLAAATAVPTIALFGPTDPTIWAPNGEQVTVIQSPDRTMEGLSVETARGHVEAILKASA